MAMVVKRRTTAEPSFAKNVKATGTPRTADELAGVAERQAALHRSMQAEKPSLAEEFRQARAAELPSLASAGRRRTTEAQRVADPSYVPTVDEALRNPDEFVAGMREMSLSTVMPAGIREHDPEAVKPPISEAPAETPPARIEGPKPPIENRTAMLRAKRRRNQWPAGRRPCQLTTDQSTFLCLFEDLGRNRFNPRENFDRMELDEFGEKLKRDGQVQAILVRKAPDPSTGRGSGVKAIRGGGFAKWEIVAGERRALAAFHAGLPGVRAELIANCDDARACELAIAENRDRRDISQVEYARGLQKLADLKGLDPAGLAKDQQLSEQHVRNLLRLLKTPAEWQQLVIDGKIDGTHLRTAAPLLHVPAIAKRLAKEIAKAEEKPSVEEWKDDVRHAAWQHGARIDRHVNAADYRKSATIEIKPTHPKWAELDVVEIGERQFALNAKLAKKVLDELEEEWRKKNRSKDGSGSKSKTAVPISAAEKRRRAEEAVKRRREKLKGIVQCWKAWLCSLHIGDDPTLATQVLVGLGLNICELPGKYDLDEFVTEFFKAKKFVRSAELLALDGKRLFEFIEGAAARAFFDKSMLEDIGGKNYYHRTHWDDEIDTWLRKLGIDLADEWRASQADGKQRFLGPELTPIWLGQKDRQELIDLAKQWKVPVLDKDSDDDLRRKLTGNAARRMPLPTELAALIKPTKAPKAKRKPR